MHPASLSLDRRPLVHGEPQASGPGPRSGSRPPGRSSGSRINLLPAPSHPTSVKQWPRAGFVPGHSGGTATAHTVFPIKPRRVPGWLTIYGYPGAVNLNPPRLRLAKVVGAGLKPAPTMMGPRLRPDQSVDVASKRMTRAATPLPWHTVSETSLGPWQVPARKTPGTVDSKGCRMGWRSW
jgi:hypothetical protein